MSRNGVRTRVTFDKIVRTGVQTSATSTGIVRSGVRTAATSGRIDVRSTGTLAPIVAAS